MLAKIKFGSGNRNLRRGRLSRLSSLVDAGELDAWHVRN